MPVLLVTTVVACTSESYDVGDGANSYLTADLALVATSADGTVRSARIDDGESLLFSNPFALNWAQKPDSVYRALLYYDKTADDTGVNITTVKARSCQQVPVLVPVDAAKVDDMHTDPLGLESVWLSKRGDYINLSLLLKSGKATGDDAVHTLGIVNNGTTTDGDKRVLHLELYHDQGSMPEYYTVQRYFSIDTATLGNVDRVELTLNTYEGRKVEEVSCLRNN